MTSSAGTATTSAGTTTGSAGATSSPWPTTVVALGFLALVGVMFWRATDGNFATIWAGVGTIVGVVTGAIPSYFFKTQADVATRRAAAESAVATLFAGAVDPQRADDIRRDHADLFRP